MMSPLKDAFVSPWYPSDIKWLLEMTSPSASLAYIHMGVSMAMEVWCFIMEKPNLKWMMTGGTPISGNLHIHNFLWPCVDSITMPNSENALVCPKTARNTYTPKIHQSQSTVTLAPISIATSPGLVQEKTVPSLTPESSHRCFARPSRSHPDRAVPAIFEINFTAIYWGENNWGKPVYPIFTQTHMNLP